MRNFATAAVVALCLGAATLAAEQQHVSPGSACVFTHGNLAWLVFAPTDGSCPIVVATFTYGGDVVPPDPTPSKVTAIWIIENQEDRTAAQATVLDDPVWQTAATVKGLSIRIEDKDHADAKPFLENIEIPLPVVCTVDGDGVPVSVVPLPGAVGGMRALIGGVK